MKEYDPKSIAPQRLKRVFLMPVNTESIYSSRPSPSVYVSNDPIMIEPRHAWNIWQTILRIQGKKKHMDIRLFVFQAYCHIMLTAYLPHDRFTTATYTVRKEDIADPYAWDIRDPKVFLSNIFKDLCHQHYLVCLKAKQ